METTPLEAGDLRWLFPELGDQREVLDLLRRAAGHIEQLADRLGTHPSWTGHGLEFHRLPEQQTTSLCGFAETADVTFSAELRLPQDPVTWAAISPPPWLVSADISVRCDSPIDCGMHEIEIKPDTEYRTPLAAANALLSVTTWLYHRGIERPPNSWRQHDPISNHP